MNQIRDFTEALPLEITTEIFFYITTFDDFLTCYWVSPTWRRLLLHYIFPRLSSVLAQNPPFATFSRFKFKAIMFREKLQRIYNVQFAPYSFAFLYMMYYVTNIDFSYSIRRINTYNAGMYMFL